MGEIALGCMALSGVYGDADENESVRLVHHAIDLDVTQLDTADSYGDGHNEELLGRALAGRRDQVVLSTKFGIQREGLGRRDTIRAALKQSLRRLRTDWVDVYYMHRIDPLTPIEESMAALAELVEEGHIRHVGLSEVSPERLRSAHAVHPVAVVQQEFSLLTRDAETELLPTMRELGVGLVAYSPLCRGLLGGEVLWPGDLAEDDPRRRRYPRFRDASLEQNLALVRRLNDVAERIAVPLPTLALAWVLSAGEDVIPLVGTRSPARLEDDLCATQVSLDPDVRAELAALAPLGAAVGDRYDPGAAAARLDR